MTTQADKVMWLTDSDGDWLKIRVKNARALCESIKDGKTYDLELKEHRERRSLDANAYCWVLIGKLAKHYGMSNDEVYKQFVRMAGTYEVLPVREDIADRFPAIWGANGIGFFVDNMGASRTLQHYINFRCFYGSHVYNTKEMSRLIDYIVDECKSAGIETLPPDKLRSMMEDWDCTEKRKQNKSPQQ